MTASHQSQKQPPKVLHFLSDGCIAELSARKPEKQKNGDDLFWFKYRHSHEPNKKEFQMSLKQIERLKSVNLLTTE
jgi:hypothetical protein